MLNQLRSLTKTWIATAFVALLVASFAVWGVADIFQSTPADAVAVVGKRQITVNRFAVEFERELARLQEQSGASLDRAMAMQLGLDRAVLGRLELNAAFDQRADALGLAASESALAKEIAAISAFSDPITGRFDADTYRMLLAQNNMNPQQFEADLRLDLIQRQLQSTLGSGIRAPSALAAARLRYARERRALSAAVIPPEAAGDIPDPSPDDVQAFYDEAAASFTIPPRRAFTFATLTLDDFAADMPVTDDELAEAYEQRKSALATPERRDIVELSAPDEATATTAAGRLRAGEAPEAVAEALGLAAPNRYADAVPTDLLAAALAEAAFAVGQGEVTDPVDGGIAWFVAKVETITAGEEQGFDELRATLADEIARAKAGDALFDAIDAFEGALNQGSSIEDAAAAAGIPSFSFGPVDAQGAIDGGVRAGLLTIYPDIVRAAFSASAAGVNSELLSLGEDGYAVVRVDEIIDATTQPLAEVEDQVRAALMLKNRSEALDALAEAARAALEAGAAPSDAAAAAGPAARGETSTLQRAEATETVSRELLTRLFAASPGAVIVAATPNGGRIAVRLDGVEPPAELSEEEADALRAVIEQEILNDLDGLYVAALREAYSVRENAALIAQATGSATP